MKQSKFVIALATAVVALNTVSCSDDKKEEDFTSNLSLSMPTLVVSADGSAATYDVDYRIDFSLERMILSASPTFGTRSFSFKTEAGKYQQNAGEWTANLGNCTIVKGASSVDDVRLKFNPSLVVPPTSLETLGLAYYTSSRLLTRYVVDDNMKAYTYLDRATFKGNFKSSYTGGDGNKVSFESDECLMEYVLDMANRKADVFIYNAKFAAPMPAQKMLWLKNLTVRLTDDGIELVGANVVPYSREGEGFTEYSDFTFNNIEFDIETPTMTNCEIEFTVAGRFFGEFEGSCVR